ncbi:hypothetical protein Z947_3155 [Sulfitobacter geojensis]|nr:hypothetical protein Z947_3155 [Sulfitobacter geojensis]NYI28494.1 hypothetical protein [Sulfitobacter geojensis]
MDLLANNGTDRGDDTGHGGADVVLIRGIGFGALLCGGFDQAVGHADHTRLAVEFEEHFDFAVFAGLANGLKADFQCLAWVALVKKFSLRREILSFL